MKMLHIAVAFPIGRSCSKKMFSKLISKLLQLIIDDNRLSNIITSEPGPTHINCYMQRGFG
jgi:hypothetical protein